MMAEHVRKPRSEEDGSYSIKRLISPPQESHSAKRPRAASSPAQRPAISPKAGTLNVLRPVTGPEKMLNFSPGQSADRSRDAEVDKHNRVSLMPLCKRGKDENGKDSGFTVIMTKQTTETEADENLQPGLDSHTVTAPVKATSPQTLTAVRRGFQEEEGEVDIQRTEATRAVVASANGVASSNLEQAGGTPIDSDVILLWVFLIRFD